MPVRAAVRLICCCVLALLLFAPPTAAQVPGGLEVITAGEGSFASGRNGGVAITPDGSTIVLSTRLNLTPSAEEGGADFDSHHFVYDDAAGTFEQVDVTPAGQSSGTGMPHGIPRITDDGRYVLFASAAVDLDPSITPATQFADALYLYLRDLSTGTTRMISRTEEAAFTVDEFGPEFYDISGDGSAIVYTTEDNPFGFCGPQGVLGVYLYLVEADTHLLVSADAEGCLVDGANPSISRDGGVISFESLAEEVNGIPSDGLNHIWTVDVATATYRRVTEQANLPSEDAEVSADGSTLVFTSEFAWDPADGDVSADVYALDLTAPAGTAPRLVSIDDDTGMAGAGEAGQATVSPQGRWVTLWAEAELAGPNTNGDGAGEAASGVYRADLATGSLLRLDLTAEGRIPRQPFERDKDSAAVAADGTVVFNHVSDDMTGTDGGGVLLARGDGSTPPPPPPGPEPLDDAIASAITISTDRFPAAGGRGGTGTHGGTADYGVLATVEGFADALSGAALAQQGPLLLTRSDALDPSTLSEFQRVLAPGDTVYVLGGEAALSAAVTDALGAAGFTVRRLAGASRFETSAVISGEARAVLGGSDVALARAFGPEGNPTAAWADSVTGGAWAADGGHQVLLTPTEGLHPAADAAIGELAPPVVRLLGGTAALGAGYDTLEVPTERTAGASRFDTARQIALDLWGLPEEGARTYLLLDTTSDLGWAYGLPAAGLAADLNAPMLAVGSTTPPETLAAVQGCDDGVTLVAIGPIPQGVAGELAAADDGACG